MVSKIYIPPVVASAYPMEPKDWYSLRDFILSNVQQIPGFPVKRSREQVINSYRRSFKNFEKNNWGLKYRVGSGPYLTAVEIKSALNLNFLDLPKHVSPRLRGLRGVVVMWRLQVGK